MAVYRVNPKDILVPEVESMQDTYKRRTPRTGDLFELDELENGARDPSPLPPRTPPPPPPPCLLDIVIGCDISGSMSGTGNNWAGVNDFVRELVTGLDAQMNGSISGIPGPSNIQVGTYVWKEETAAPQVVRNMTDDSLLIEGDTNSPLLDQILGVPVGGGDDYDAAVSMGMTMLNNFGALGNRSSQPNYRRIMIIVTDANSINACTGSPGTLAGLQTNMANDVWYVGSNAGSPELDVEVYAFTVHSAFQPPTGYPGNINCLVPASAQATNVDHGTGAVLGTLGATLANMLCAPPPPPPSWNCSGLLSDLGPGTPTTPWTCYDPGTGQGQYTVYNDCVTACNAQYLPGQDCLLDIVIAVDLSASGSGPGSDGPAVAGLPSADPDSWFGRYDDLGTTAPGSTNALTGLPNSIISQTVGGYTGHPFPYEAQRMLLEKLLDDLEPGMTAGTTQVGVIFWADQAQSINPDGFSMTTNAFGDLSTAKTIADPNGDLHSPIAMEMMNHFGGIGQPGWANPGWYPQGTGTDIANAIKQTFGGTGSSGVNVGLNLINQKTSSSLASQYPSRELDPSFIQVGIIITDSANPPQNSGIQNWPPQPWQIPPQFNFPNSWWDSGCPHQSWTLDPTPWVMQGTAKQVVIGCVARPGPFLSLPNTQIPGGPTGAGMVQDNVKDTLDAITCGQNTGTDPWNSTTPAQYPLGNNFGFYVDTRDPNSIATVGTAIATLACGIPPSIPITYDCTWIWGPTPTNTTIGLIGQCVPEYTGNGDYTTLTGPGGCEEACKEHVPIVWENAATWKCHLPFQATIGYCTEVWDGSGYTIKQDCIDICKEHQLWERPVLGGDPCEKCCCEATQSGPGMPWTCIPGTQIMAAGTLNPCDCATINLNPATLGNWIDCTEDVGPPVPGYNCPPTGLPCTYVFGNPTYTAANAALNLNPATPGIPYPNNLAGALAYCEDSCLPIVGTITCPKIQSCPCGWDSVQSTTSPGVFNCTIEDPLTGTVVVMPAIIGNGAIPTPGCLYFPPPIAVPVTGDAWAHSGSYAGYSWTDAQVVDASGFVSASGGGVGTRTSCSP